MSLSKDNGGDFQQQNISGLHSIRQQVDYIGSLHFFMYLFGGFLVYVLFKFEF